MAEMVRKVPFFIGSRYAQATSIAKQANISMETFWNSMLEARTNSQTIAQLQPQARRVFGELAPQVSHFERIEKSAIGFQAKLPVLVKVFGGGASIVTGVVLAVVTGIRALQLPFSLPGTYALMATSWDSARLQDIRRIARNSNEGWKKVWNTLVKIKDSSPHQVNGILENVDFEKPPETFAQARFARVSQARSSWEHVRLIRQTALE